MITLALAFGLVATLSVAGVIAGATLPYLRCVGPKRDLWLGVVMLVILLLTVAVQALAIVKMNLDWQ